MKRVLLSVLLAAMLTVVVVHVISVMAKAVIPPSREQASVCVYCAEGAGRDSLIRESLIAGEKAEQADGTYRGLWVWNVDIVAGTAARHEFFTFAQLKNVSSTYLYAYDLLPNSSSELGDFVVRAEDIGVGVELLAGDPTWALTTTHPIALGFVQQAITFTQSITKGARPVGIHLDVEPYLLPEWNSDRSSTITQYLDLLSDAHQELAASSTSLTFTVDMPFWYDIITATYQSVTKPLNQHVQDIVDRVVIMDYRDFAEGNDGIIDHAQNEMDYAQSIAKGVVIGVETNDVEPEKVTFFEEGETVMESELALVEQHYHTNSAFRGFAIHDYSGYRALAPIKSVHLPLVLKSYPADRLTTHPSRRHHRPSHHLNPLLRHPRPPKQLSRLPVFHVSQHPEDAGGAGSVVIRDVVMVPLITP